MSFGPVVDELIEALKILPGVGQKSAQRMALMLLDGERRGSTRLVNALANAIDKVGHCSECRSISELNVCLICLDEKRERQTLCVVESPADLIAIEQAHHFKGLYFVLNGSLSPLDGKGPNEIGFPELFKRVDSLGVKEIIAATNPTVEGEATAHYLADVFRGSRVLITRLAHGIPLGGSLGYVDGGTLNHAFSGRKPMTDEL
ncbi:MAG: recombination protein RecR [Oleiphilaceae bacterium]|jgi:recombination protein RecR